MQSAKCKMRRDVRNAQPVIGDLSERLLAFAVRTGKAVNALPATRLGRHIAAQLVRSGTSAAPNYEEGCAAESRADFVHKLSICSEGTARIAVLDSFDCRERTVADRKRWRNCRTNATQLVQDTRPIHCHREEEQRDGKPVTASAQPFCILHFAFFILHSSLLINEKCSWLQSPRPIRLRTSAA